MVIWTLLIAGAILVLVLLWVGLPAFLRYRRYRGKRIVQCPETRRPVGVDVDARHAALHTSGERPELRLSNCTRWPERADCGQDCLAQIERAPEECLVRNILADWYQQGVCVFCGRKFGSVDSYDHVARISFDKKPGLRGPAGELREWSDVPVENLTEVLETHDRVCWDCLLNESFRRDHPDLVVDRPSRDNTGVGPA